MLRITKNKILLQMCYQKLFQAQVRNSENTFNQCNWLQIKGKAAKVERTAARICEKEIK